MSNQMVHRRYAQALYDEAVSEEIVEKVDEDIAFMRRTLRDHRRLALLFKSPLVSKEKKQAVIDGLLDEKVQPLTLSFLRMVVRKEREAELDSILIAYQQLRDEESGVVAVQVQVAQPLDADAEGALSRRLNKLVDGKVRLETKVNEELIGGLIVRIGDVVYNGSVQHHLASLHDRMRQGASSAGRAEVNGSITA